MKKKSEKRIITAIVTGIAAVVAFACGAVLSACGGSSKILETPTNLQIADEYLTWDEVEDAKSYVVEINGEEYTTQTNSLDIMEITIEPITYKFTVFAVGDNEKIYDSDPSEEIEYTLEYSKYLEYKSIDNGTAYEVSAIQQRAMYTDKILIPEYNTDGKPITRIGKNAFRDCMFITSVYIPDTIKELGQTTFTSSSNLKRVRLSESLRTLPENTFNSCTSLKNIVIPSSVTEIGKQAFANCTALEDITFNEGLKVIETFALAECKALTSLNLPSSVEQISLKTGSAVYQLIRGCDNLESLSVAQGKNATYKSDGNCIIVNENELLFGLKTSVIPDYITKIKQNAFRECSGLKEITIPESVKEIENSAFADSGLKYAVIPEGVTVLGQNVFSNCAELEEVRLPSTLTQLGIMSFFKCSNLTRLTVAEENPVFKSGGNCIISKADNVLVAGCSSSVIPEYVTAIGEYAFSGIVSLKNITIPQNVTEIQKCAFISCIGLENITISEGVTKIGKSAFSYCGQLQSVIIPKSITVIENSAFSDCTNLRSVFIPDSVTEIKAYAFSGCRYASFVIPANVKTIGETAFSGAGIFMPYKPGEEPEGWYKVTHPYTGTTAWYSMNVFFALLESELRYENNYAYVYSVKSEKNYVNDIYLRLSIIAPYRLGYTFLGWATEEGSTEVVYGVEEITFEYDTEDGQHIKVENLLLSYLPEDLPEDTLLYAVWEKNN